MSDISELVGETLTGVEQVGDSILRFTLDGGDKYELRHNQDCCENVSIEDIAGDLKDLIGSPITKAEESTSHTNPDGVTKGYQDSFTWTFYHFATVNGYVTVRWYGESNGYYSESVDFEKVES